MKSDLHDITDETLAAAHDAHYIAGELMAERVDHEAIGEAAKQLERAGRKLRKLAEAVELTKTINRKKP